jgi:hypothetical protein
MHYYSFLFVTGRKIEKIIQILDDHTSMVKKTDFALTIEEIVKETLLVPMNELKRYAYYSFMVELLCLLNVIAQFFFMDHFMGGEFLSYGPRGNYLYFSNAISYLFVDLQCIIFTFQFCTLQMQRSKAFL